MKTIIDKINRYYGGAWGSDDGGTVQGPVSSTDNAVARFNGTSGEDVQDSSVVISDVGAVTAGNGTAALPAFGFTADPNTGMYSISADILGIATNGTEKLRVLSNGNVLVGTTTDAGAKLYVNGNVAVDDSLFVLGDNGSGISGTLGLTNVADSSANSVGLGTIKFKGATSRDSVGFLKMYSGTTVIYVPYFTAITG